MDFRLLTYSELQEVIHSIRNLNQFTQDRNAHYVESTANIIQGTVVEPLSRSFDGHRYFFRHVETILEDFSLPLEQQQISYGLVERMSHLGEVAQTMLFSLWENTNKETLNSVSDLRNDLNSWYALIGDNLNSISELERVADTLNTN